MYRINFFAGKDELVKTRYCAGRSTINPLIEATLERWTGRMPLKAVVEDLSQEEFDQHDCTLSEEDSCLCAQLYN